MLQGLQAKFCQENVCCGGAPDPSNLFQHLEVAGNQLLPKRAVGLGEALAAPNFTSISSFSFV